MNLPAYHTTAMTRRLGVAALAGALFVLTVQVAPAANYVVAWGGNSFGQTNVPPDLGNVLAVAAGSVQSLALRGDGTVVSWGDPSASTSPEGLSNVVAIAAGDRQNLALKSDGTVVAWGNPTYAITTNVPAGLSNVVAVACGDHHNLLLKADGTVFAWGRNYSGQTDIPADLSNVVAIVAGNTGNLAIRKDGTVWGSRFMSNIVAGFSNMVAGAVVASGSEQGALIQNDGTAVAWYSTVYPNVAFTNTPGVIAGAGCSAYNQAGELWGLRRDGTLVGLEPKHPLGQTNIYKQLSNVLALAVGFNHHLAIVGDGLPVPTTVLSNPLRGSNHFSIQQSTVRGLAYRLEFKNSPNDPNWQMLPPVPGDGTVRTLADPNPASPQRIYRVRVAP